MTLNLLFALSRRVPPSSIVNFVTLNGVAFVHLVMSSVPPAWIVTGTDCDEIAFSGTAPELRDELITTVPPKISAPPSMRWSVWLFAIVSVPAPILTSLGYVPLLVIGG